MKIPLYEEFCCEMCNEVVHNHIDCPSCEEKYVETDKYGPIEVGDVITCTNCSSRFKLISGIPVGGQWFPEGR